MSQQWKEKMNNANYSHIPLISEEEEKGKEKEEEGEETKEGKDRLD